MKYNKTYLTKSQSRFWASELPVGDATGGPAFGDYFDPATAIIGGSIASALIGGSAAQSAASTQAGAANSATNAQTAMYNTNQANLKPYMTQGTTALNTLNADLNNGTLGGNFTPADLTNGLSPSYNFTLAQGQQALQNSQAAGDGVLSGAALKGLINYNQGQASTGYQQAYNNWLTSQQNTYGQLSGLASMGENAAAGAGNTGASYANSMANTMTGAANASAAGTVGTANAITGAINNGTSAYTLSNLINPSGSGAPVDMTGFTGNGAANPWQTLPPTGQLGTGTFGIQ